MEVLKCFVGRGEPVSESVENKHTYTIPCNFKH